MRALISPERPDTADAQALITELEAHLASFYPVESRHGFSVAKLLAENVTFFVTRYDGAPAGCGGIKLFGREAPRLTVGASVTGGRPSGPSRPTSRVDASGAADVRP